MSAYWSNLATVAGALRWPILAITALAVIGILLARRSPPISAHVDQALADGWDAWVETALLMSETPIYDATAAHIAAHEAADLDNEWRDVAEGGWTR
jgi:hypothetical protein